MTFFRLPRNPMRKVPLFPFCRGGKCGLLRLEDSQRVVQPLIGKLQIQISLVLKHMLHHCVSGPLEVVKLFIFGGVHGGMRS